MLAQGQAGEQVLLAAWRLVKNVGDAAAVRARVE